MVKVVHFNLAAGGSYTTPFGCFYMFIGRMQGGARGIYIGKYNSVTKLFEDEGFPFDVTCTHGLFTITNARGGNEDGIIYCLAYY